jgi:hypothetical protein
VQFCSRCVEVLERVLLGGGFSVADRGQNAVS